MTSSCERDHRTAVRDANLDLDLDDINHDMDFRTNFLKFECNAIVEL